MAELKTLFGAMLRRQRTLKGWSQVELAERAGLSQEMVAKLERAVLGASFETVEKLATTLGVPASSLFGVDVTSDPKGRLEAMLLRLARLNDPELAWVEGLITAAMARPQ